MKILIIAGSDIKTDPRVQRQIKALEGHEIKTCAGVNGDFNFYTSYGFSLARKFKRFFWLLTGQFEKFYWHEYLKTLAGILKAQKFDRVIANDIDTLPLALSLGTKVYFDAHEYHPQEWDSLKWKLLYKKYKIYLCKKYIPKADSFSTVNESLANEYKKFIGRKPEVVTNASNYQDLKPTEISNPIKLIHHGAAIPERKIENMIRMMEYLPGHVLYLMLTPFDKNYYDFLVDMRSERVIFIPAVSPSEVCKTLNQFDIGIYILPPTNFNNINALPNKIFDFIQARLAIAVSANPEMARVVNQNNLGAVAEGYSTLSLVRAINRMRPDKIMQYKNASDKAAKELSAEQNYSLIRKLVFDI